ASNECVAVSVEALNGQRRGEKRPAIPCLVRLLDGGFAIGDPVAARGGENLGIAQKSNVWKMLIVGLIDQIVERVAEAQFLKSEDVEPARVARFILNADEPDLKMVFTGHEE